MRIKITQRVADSATAQEKPYELHDTELKGLLLRVQPSGLRSFIVQWGRGKRRTLGRYPVMTVAAARATALTALAESAEHGAPLAVIEAASPKTEPVTYPTVADVCTNYVEWLKLERRDSAATDVHRRFERAVYSDPIANIKIAELVQDDIEAWRARVERGELATLATKRGRPPTSKPLSRASVNRMRTPLIAALNRAISRRQAAQDKVLEWSNVKPYKGVGGQRSLYLNRDERKSLLQHSEADIRAYMECIILTGCRPGDPALVKRKDYDSRHGAVKFRTKNHERLIPVSPATKTLLDNLAEGKAPDDLLFTNAGRPWLHYDWAEKVRQAATSANLPDGVVLYTLRHCWITDAIVIARMDLLTVAKLTGTSLAMIEKHYGHLVQDAARDKLSAVDFL